jgi:hypothetical protein
MAEVSAKHWHSLVDGLIPASLVVGTIRPRME